MSNQTISGKTNYNTDPNHIYYNLQLFNNDTIGRSNSVPVRFQETRTSTILANPSEYFLSIIRFHIDTPSLPLIMPEVETDPTFNPSQDVDQLIYQIAVYKQGNVNPPLIFPIKFSKEFQPFVPPPSQLDVNAISNPYYFVSEIDNFLDMINRSLQDAFITTAAGLQNLNRTDVPFFYKTSGNLFNIAFPQPQTSATYNANGSRNTAGVDGGNNTYSSIPNINHVVIAFNSPLHTLFSSFQYRYIDSLNNLTLASFPPLSNAKQTAGWYELVIKQPSPTGSTNTSIFNTNIAGYSQIPASAFPYSNTSFYNNNVTSFTVLTQPYSSAPLWNPVKQVIFTTALMPVNNELIGLPGVVNSNTSLDTDVQNNNFSPVITDIEVPMIRGDETKCNISYTPSAEYRLIDLQSNVPINSIEVSVFWKDQYGVLHPFVLDPGCFSSIKICLRKKIFNLIYLPEYTKDPTK